MTLWLIVLGMGIVTYGIRLSMMVVVQQHTLPAMVREALRYVTPAALTAIIVPAILYLDGTGAFDAGPGNERVPAALLAIGVSWFTKSVWATIGVGMVALWVLQALG